MGAPASPLVLGPAGLREAMNRDRDRDRTLSGHPGEARFVVIGVGGLGCPALLGLEAGGASAITIVDDDRVDAGNLPRQVLFGPADVGVAKVDAAGWSLRGRRAERGRPLEIASARARLDAGGLGRLLDAIAEPTIVLECSDSPSSKFALHDVCVERGVPVVVGGVVGWHGQAMAVDPRRPATACYRCVFEQPPPRELAPACAEVGVAGPAAGVVGHAMALLALGLAGALPPSADSPAGTLVHLDLLRGGVRRLAPRPRPGCPHPHDHDHDHDSRNLEGRPT